MDTIVNYGQKPLQKGSCPIPMKRAAYYL